MTKRKDERADPKRPTTETGRIRRDAAVRGEQLAALNRIALALTNVVQFDEAFQAVAREMVTLLDARGCGIGLLDDTRSRLTVVAEHAKTPAESTVGLDLPLAKGNLPSLQVVKTGKAVVVDRAQSNPDVESLHETFKQRGTESLLIAPLIVRGTVIGTIAIDTDRADREFGPDEVRLVETVAGQMAQSIANARLFAQERQSRKVAEKLQEVTRAINESLDLGAVLDAILDQLEQVIEYDCASVQLVEDEAMRVIAIRDMPQEEMGRIRKLVDFPYNRRLATNPEPFILETKDDNTFWIADSEEIAMIRSNIGIPLLVRDEIIGALTINSLQPHFYDETDMRIASAFGRQAAVAIENARLFAAAHQELADRKKVEAELRDAKEAADAANQAKSVFLATMSHELRTPLNAIIGFSSVLESSLSNVLTDKQKNFLNNIRSSGEYLLAIVNNVLDLSKIDAGAMSMDVDQVDLRDSISGVCIVLRGTTLPRGIGFDVDVEKEAETIEADPLKLKQIIYNILANAVKFSPDESVIRVTASVLDPDSSPLRRESIRVTVKDEGIGINPEQHEAIFREFFQLRSRSGRPEGTGLGLTLVKRLVDLHGGLINVRSAPGEGSEFSVTLPRRAKT